MEYDFRERFGFALDDIGGRRMSWGEVIRLLTILRQDPGSQFCASLERWTHAASREWTMLAQLYDLQHMSKSKKKPDPWPRPWDKGKGSTTRHGNAAGRTRGEVVAILNAHGHNLPPV